MGAESDWKEISWEQFQKDLWKAQIDCKNWMNPLDTIIVSNDVFEMLCVHGLMVHNTQPLTYSIYGYNVIRCFGINGQMIFTNHKYVPYYMKDSEPEPEGDIPVKQEPKAYPFRCRVCGTRYQSKQEARDCQRSHEWQNRKGRR